MTPSRLLCLLFALLLTPAPLAADSSCPMRCDRERLACDHGERNRDGSCAQDQQSCHQACQALAVPPSASGGPQIRPQPFSLCRQQCEEGSRLCHGSNREGSRHRAEVCEQGRLSCHERCPVEADRPASP
ncbi:MAG TPA: hypothetical protein VFV27_03505 [Nevskiaceae bacterium]|nr:hypothetical protein [Nevskiaceae bacterium]